MNMLRMASASSYSSTSGIAAVGIRLFSQSINSGQLVGTSSMVRPSAFSAPTLTPGTVTPAANGTPSACPSCISTLETAGYMPETYSVSVSLSMGRAQPRERIERRSPPL